MTIFEKMFDTKFSRVVPYISGTGPKNFEVTLEEAKVVVV